MSEPHINEITKLLREILGVHMHRLDIDVQPW